MSENLPEVTEDIIEPTEIDLLKERATQMGIKFRDNIGVDTLRKKIDAKIAGEADPEDNLPVATEDAPELTPRQLMMKKRSELRKECAKLMRVNVVCFDPAKRDYPGDVFSVGNQIVGNFRRYIPFNTENGTHIEKILYDMLKGKQVQIFVDKKDKRGRKTKESKLIKAYGIEVLPDLTPEELKELERQQAAKGGV